MPGSPRFCDWCAKNVVENCAYGLDTHFHDKCENRKCAGGRAVRGLIVLDGDKSKLKARISTLLDDAGNTEASHGENKP